MFRQTLGGAARNWFDDLDPKSVDSFEELSQKFLEEFSQQKRYAKDPTEIHGIKRRQNEGLQAFMDRFKSKSSHIKGVPPVLRIVAFMHGHGHPELAMKLNDKILKTVDEMFESLGDEGPSSEGTKLSSTFITTEGFLNRSLSNPSAHLTPTDKLAPPVKVRKLPPEEQRTIHLRESRRLEDQSITKEKVRKERSKSRRKRSRHQEASSNSEYEEELPLNIRVYEGNKDSEDHLGIFSAAPEQEEWPMPVDATMFANPKVERQRNMFNDLEPKRRQNEGLQAFMDRFKSESSHIKGVPLVLRISAFMNGHGHPELAKKLNDKIPKTVDEMFERVREFIKGEVAVGSAEMVHPSQGDKGSPKSAHVNLRGHKGISFLLVIFEPLTSTLEDWLSYRWVCS
ncbi:reverse transcriptase domain-containing protein [Tanacetum coccineum]